MITWIMFVVGILIGCLLTTILRKPKHAGTLLLYKEAGETEPALLLELEEPANKLYQHYYVIFKISSQK